MIAVEEIKQKHGNEAALLLLCCRVFLKTENASVLSEFILKNPPDPIVTYELAKTHRIRPIVFETLNGISHLNESLKAMLKQFFVRHSYHAFQCKQKTEQMITLMQQHQIPIQLYKGTHLCQALYQHLSIREFGDIDFIVNKDDVVKLVEVLKNNGYTIEGEELFNRSKKNYLKHQKDILCFEKTSKGSFLYEFHYKPTGSYLALNVSFKDLLPDEWQIGTDFSACDYTSLLTINHGVVDLYPNLRSLVDIGILQQQCSLSKNVKRHHQLYGFYALNSYLSNKVLGVNSTALSFADNQKQVTLLGDKVIDRLFKNKELGRVSTSAILQASLLLRKGFFAKAKLIKAISKYIITPNYNDAPESNFKYKWLHVISRPIRLLQHFKRHV